ncbi:MAG: Trm112 family protein [Candidatus Methanomethyliaceae archaeon]|nr:Trm112 family protein [Candidatus Methanomethyliaceae archaeon]
MKRKLLDILACPMCKYYPLELIVFEEREEIEEGLLICNNCSRWYPIIEAIPHMLPDDLRDREDLEFLKKWQERIPEKILKNGKPFNIEG